MVNKEAMNGQWLARIAATLERWMPQTPVIDWSVSLAACWQPSGTGGHLVERTRADDIDLDDLLGIERQKRSLQMNTRQFLKRLPANNALLWGSRGTGKSTLVHALLNRYAGEGLRLIELDKSGLQSLALVAAAVQRQPYRFVLFSDDLSFDAGDPSYRALKSALEGSVFKGFGNVLIYATSNRRHLMPEHLADNEPARLINTEIHHGETVEEQVSLSDRFGLWLSFYPFSQDSYLEIAQHWVLRLSTAEGAPLDFDDHARAEALRWALERGGRSGRVAQQFARHWVGARLLARSP